VTGLKEPLDVRLVDPGLLALTLAVGPERPPHVRPLVELDAGPSEGFDELLLALGAVSASVCVFDPKDQCAALLLGIKPIEKDGA
jgi:hypothetical protein